MRLQLVPGSIITLVNLSFIYSSSTLKAFASGRTKYIKHIFFCFTTILLLGDSFHFLLLSASSQGGPPLAAFGVHVKFLSVLTINCKMADSATGFFLFSFSRLCSDSARLPEVTNIWPGGVKKISRSPGPKQLS